jgi:hypothetical protein
LKKKHYFILSSQFGEVLKGLYIYLRHVKETQIGTRFQNKSVFQYKLEEIKRLITIVLETIHNEIEEYFEAIPDKLFARKNDRAI